MSNDENDDKSMHWWQAAPKVVAAIASLLTATTGLLLAAHQLGYLQAPFGNHLVDKGGGMTTELPFFMVRLIKAEDLTGMNDSDLDRLRNEIYARHGRKFQRQDLQSYFDRQPWYKPIYEPDAFPANVLTAIQQQNVSFISSYQRTQHR